MQCMNCCFEVASCPHLEELTIGAYSFIGYSKFILHGACEALHWYADAPCLQTLSIGSINYESNNFFSCNTLELIGTHSFDLRELDLPSLNSIVLGDGSFSLASQIIFQSRRSSIFLDSQIFHRLFLLILASPLALETKPFTEEIQTKPWLFFEVESLLFCVRFSSRSPQTETAHLPRMEQLFFP